MVLEKTLESPLDCKKIQPVHSERDQSGVFIGRTDVEYIMRNAELDETQARIKIAERNINNLRYANDNTLTAK